MNYNYILFDELREKYHDPVSMFIIRGSEDSYSGSSSREQTTFTTTTFSDGACGEPLTSQHLMLDFTPVEDVDNEFVQRKCCAFWEFVNSRKDMHHLMVAPETYDSLPAKKKSPRVDKKIEKKPEGQMKKSTAVTMLEFIERKGLIDRTFEAKLPKSLCSLGSREYQENRLSSKTSPNVMPACSCKGVCKSCKNWRPGSIIPDSKPKAKRFEREMRKWDRNHIQSMDPAGHPPALSHCILQRNFTN